MMEERKNFKPIPGDYRREQTYGFYPSFEPIVRDKKRERDSIQSMWKNIRNDDESTDMKSPAMYNFQERGYNRMKRQLIVNTVGLSPNDRNAGSPPNGRRDAGSRGDSDSALQRCNRTLQPSFKTPQITTSRVSTPPQLRDINTWLTKNSANSSRYSTGNERKPMDGRNSVANRGCTTHRAEHMRPKMASIHKEGPGTVTSRTHGDYRYENTSALSSFPGAKCARRHFFIDPEWVSESLTIKKMKAECLKDPLRYGWI